MARASRNNASTNSRPSPVPRLRAHVEAFHFARGTLRRARERQRPHCDAPERRLRRTGKQQAAARRRIRTRKRCEFLRKVLEAQIDLQPCCVLFEQSTRLCEVGNRRGLPYRGCGQLVRSHAVILISVPGN